jgi:hypothetical protein
MAMAVGAAETQVDQDRPVAVVVVVALQCFL